MSVLKYNINLKEQVQRTYTKTAPTQEELHGFNVSVSDETIEYSFTGTKEQIEEQLEEELNKAYFNPSSATVSEATILEVGLSVQATVSRSEGEMWNLQIRTGKLLQTLEATQSEVEQQQKEKYGTPDRPKIVNTSVTAIQQSILFKEPYKSWDAEKLGALKQYINGASPLTVIPNGLDADGNPQNKFLKDILLHTDPNVLKAIKNPVYYVPSVNITVSYWSETPVANMNGIGTQKAPSGGNFQFSAPYISVFMGASSSPAEGGGYQVQETYSIGQYDPDMLATSTTTTN